MLIGKELYSGQGLVYDPFEMYGDALPGPNMLVLGDVGNGKSALVKTYLLRQLRFGRQVAVLDSKNQKGAGEYAQARRGPSASRPCGSSPAPARRRAASA